MSSIDSVKIQKLEIEPYGPSFEKIKNLSLYQKISKDGQSQIDSLLKKIWPRKQLTLEIRCNISVASALRRVIIDELKVKAFYCTEDQLKTDEPFIIRSELIDRIRFIPIPQNSSGNLMTAGKTFSISKTNQGRDNLVITSRDISPSISLPYVRLAELSPGKYLEISGIEIREGKGRDHASYSLSSNVSYKTLDFIDVHFLTDKGNVIKRRVSRDYLYKHLPKTIQNRPVDDKWEPKILVIPNSQYEKLAPKNITKYEDGTQKFDYILENADITPVSSMSNQPQRFQIQVRTNGNIEAKEIIPMVCDNIIERMNQLDPRFEKRSTQEGEELNIIEIQETFTVSELLRQHMYWEDPNNLNLLNIYTLHPRKDIHRINIIHPNAEKIYHTAVKKIINTFQSLKKNAAKETHSEKH